MSPNPTNDSNAADETDLLAKIEQMPAGDREMDKARYSTFGFSPQAALDNPSTGALACLTAGMALG